MIERATPQVIKLNSWASIKARLIENLQKQCEGDSYSSSGFCATELFNEKVSERLNEEILCK